MPRPRADDPDRLKLLQQRLEQVQRQIRLQKARERDQTRRDDARRKIIAGALALEHRDRNPDSEFGRLLLRLLDEYARPEDRRLFEFLPTRDAPPAPGISEAAE
jgi:hypothetical protein